MDFLTFIFYSCINIVNFLTDINLLEKLLEVFFTGIASYILTLIVRTYKQLKNNSLFIEKYNQELILLRKDLEQKLNNIDEDLQIRYTNLNDRLDISFENLTIISEFIKQLQQGHIHITERIDKILVLLKNN